MFVLLFSVLVVFLALPFLSLVLARGDALVVSSARYFVAIAIRNQTLATLVWYRKAPRLTALATSGSLLSIASNPAGRTVGRHHPNGAIAALSGEAPVNRGDQIHPFTIMFSRCY